MPRYILYARKSQEDEGRQQQSIADQVRLMTEIAERHGLDLADALTEEKSAKEPYQRPVFDQMMRILSKGQADSILCYHVNRLARNMVEGGLLQHLLTKGQIQEIRTYSESFKSGDNILPFILQTAMSTQYSLDLSQVVRRGIQSKVEKGDYPQRAPEGYVNNLSEHTIEADPVRFRLVRQAWERMLTGQYSLPRLVSIMNDEWGYTTRKNGKVGGKPLTVSILHRIFHNIVYTGYFLHGGELYRGNHPPMVSFTEFEAVQAILGRHGQTRPRAYEFAYTGLIVCDHCGRQVTAELKRGRHRRGRYIYYHCANLRACRSAIVREETLDAQLEARLAAIAIRPDFHALAKSVIERLYQSEQAQDQAQQTQLTRAREEAKRRKSRLIHLMLDELISPEDFEQEKRALEVQANRCQSALAKAADRKESAQAGAGEVAAFAVSAPVAFRQADVGRKRQIARTLATTYRLRDGELRAELHPLFAPLLMSPLEPRTTGSHNQKGRTLCPSIPCGWTEGRLTESLTAVWKLLLEGTPRLFWSESGAEQD